MQNSDEIGWKMSRAELIRTCQSGVVPWPPSVSFVASGWVSGLLPGQVFRKAPGGWHESFCLRTNGLAPKTWTCPRKPGSKRLH